LNYPEDKGCNPYPAIHSNVQAAYVKGVLLGKAHTWQRQSTFNIHFEGSTSHLIGLLLVILPSMMKVASVKDWVTQL